MDNWSMMIVGIIISGPALTLMGAYLFFEQSIPVRKMWGKMFLMSGVICITFLLVIVFMSGWFF